jgi:hypothetical protein
MKTTISLSSCAGLLLTSVLLAGLSQRALAAAPIEENQKYAALVERFQTDFGMTIKLARPNDALIATSYDMKPLLLEHLDNTLKVLTWIETEFKRYPAGFIKHYGSRNLVLANSYLTKTRTGTALPYSPPTIPDKRSGSILLTVPSNLTPSSEVLAKGSIHTTLIAYVLDDFKSPDLPISLAYWKTLPPVASTPDTVITKKLSTLGDQRVTLFKMFWDPFDFTELNAEAKTNPLLNQKVELIKSFLGTLEAGFDQTFWANLAIIPESQRTVCLNDLADLHSADQIKADPEIQSDLRSIEKKWGLKVLWEPGSAAPPMPVRVRLEYSYFTDKKLPQFKQFIHLVREELEPYPDEIVTRLNVKNVYILDDFIFRGAKLAGQGIRWLPQVSFAYGISSFDPSKSASRDFYRRTIHHEVFHLIDARFSVKGGPIHGSNWDSLNEEGFAYKVGRPSASAPSQLRFYKDNIKRQGFAEPYGMNIATDDRATLYARLMTGDQPFLTKLKTDKILKAKTERILEFFQLLKRDLAIPSPDPFYTKLERRSQN